MIEARTTRAGLAYLTGAVVLLGAGWPLTRYALLQGAGPGWFALGRAGLSALVATIALAGLGRLRWPGRRDLPAVFAVGLLQLALFFALTHEAVAFVPAGRTAVLANCTIPFTVPLSLLLLGEAIPPRRWVAAGLGVAGMVVLSGPWSIDWSARHMLLGHAELAGAALSWSLAMVVVRRYPPVLPMSALLPWTFGLATVVLLPLALRHGVGAWPPAALIPLAVVGLIVAPAGTWCVMQGQVRLPLIVASIGFLAGPAVGVVLAALFLGERLGPDIRLGAGLILAAAVLASMKERSV